MKFTGTPANSAALTEEMRDIAAVDREFLDEEQAQIEEDTLCILEEYEMICSDHFRAFADF